VSLPLLIGASSRADIPVGYKGTPFDPALAGGAGVIPPTVKAGPYAIPGRIDFVNYDMGGEMVAFHAGDHILTKGGAGYRTDMPVATFSKTTTTDPDVWYMTGAAVDGTDYPTPTTADFYIGAVQVGDWYNFTVDVMTAGTYSLSSTWSSGNGPPGGEGGDGAMGLEVLSNGTMLATWSTTFPNYMTEANFHHWIAYPNFATVTLAAGIQVIKLQSTSKHLNLDYVEFTLGPIDGGAAPGADSSASAGGTGSGTSTGSGASTGPADTSGAISGSSIGAAGAPSGTMGMTGSSASGSTMGGSGIASSGTLVGASGSGNSGTSPSSGGGTASGGARGTVSSDKSGKGCSVGPTGLGSLGGESLVLSLGGFLMARRRKASPRRA
jgi:hypothetical protein